jgi:hypothetical protein
MTDHPLVQGSNEPIATFDLPKALYVCQLISTGKTMQEIFVGGDARVPEYWDFVRWAITVPELTKALEAARQLSAYALEDEAVHNARELAKAPGSTQRVAAYRVAIDQLRWSAERRNAAAFGNKGVQTTVVPITIQTTLDIGQPGGGVKQGIGTELYTVTAKVEIEADEPEAIDGGKLIDVLASEVVDTTKPALRSAAELLGETTGGRNSGA